MVKKAYSITLLFLVLSAILIICWFRFGLMYGGGDTGLPTYNPKVMAGIASNIWWDSLAPGIPVAQGLTSVPMLFLLSIPQILGAGPVLIQELLFFSLLFLMGYGMYLLALSIFGKSNYLMAIASGVFYMFNPYMMVQIWHRFIHNSMFFVSFVPFLVMSWLRWIRERKPISLLVFLLLNFLAVYIFGTIAFIVGFWLFLFLLTVLEGVIPWKGKKAMIELSLAFVIGLVFWLLTNSWWIIPTFNISPTLFAEQHTTNDSLATLMDLSAQTILPYTLRLINPFYLYWHADWGDIYQNIIFLSISWLFVLVVFIGFLKGLKQRQYVKWSLLFLIFIILGKGAAPPFGFPYIWGFSNFFPLGVIRNPFEKLGILLPLIYAILFAYGLKILMSYLNNRIGKGKASFILVVFIISNLAFLWPMFAGKLFGTLDKQNFVQVPPDYGLADNWIRKDLAGTKEGRILHLPLSRSESITYNWQNGYNGVEPSAALFTSLPSIARNLDIPKVSGAISALSLIFHKPYAKDPAVILKLLQDFSIKYIIIHNDVDWLKNELSNPREVEEVLAKLDFLEKEISFGSLSIYKIKDQFFQREITISDNLQLLYNTDDKVFWPWMVSTPSAEMVSIYNGQEGNILNQANKIIVFPDRQISVKDIQVPKFRGNLDDFVAVRALPNNPLYFLFQAKEWLSLIGKKLDEEQKDIFVLAEKRLIEMYKIKRMREMGAINQKEGNEIILSLINRYQDVLNKIFQSEAGFNNFLVATPRFSTTDTFLKHISLLKELSESTTEPSEKNIAEEAIELINRNLIRANFFPKYPQISQLSENKLDKNYGSELYRFNVPIKSNYEIFMTNPQVRSIYPNGLSQINFQINDHYKSVPLNEKNGMIYLGEEKMNVDEYQTVMPRLSSVNLAPSINDWQTSGDVVVSEQAGTIELSSDKKNSAYIESDIKPLFGQDLFLVAFDTKLVLGKRIRVQLTQDIDPFDKLLNKTIYRYDNYFTPVDKDGWNQFSVMLDLHFIAQKAKLKIQVEPWDDCLVVLADKKSCEDTKKRQQYNRPSKFLIKNISVDRVLNNVILLSSNLPATPSAATAGDVVQRNKQNSSLYTGKISMKHPGLLLFKQSFSPDWQLNLTKDNNIYQPTEHLIGNLFANAWWIDEAGDYDFTLSYLPQKNIQAGLLSAGLGWVILILMLMVNERHKLRRLVKIK